MRIYRIRFDVWVQDLPEVQHESVLAGGTDDINAIIKCVKDQVMSRPVEIEVWSQEAPGEKIKLSRPVTGFELVSIEPQKEELAFIDVNSLVASGILSFVEHADLTEDGEEKEVAAP